MSELVCNVNIDVLINILEGFRGNKNAQAYYMQAYIQKYGPIPNEYAAKIRKLME